VLVFDLGKTREVGGAVVRAEKLVLKMRHANGVLGSIEREREPRRASL
jgi:hypothetical protein